MSDQENLVRKKRVRAGHRASTTRIIAQARENMEQEERNTAALTQQMTALKTKLDLLTALDAEILELTLNEDEIAQEIEHADTYKAQLQTMVFELEGALKTKGKDASTLEVRQNHRVHHRPCSRVTPHVNLRKRMAPTEDRE